ncbi:MAG: HAMP domain-containing sensor histidine kinase [Asticcacaulis sp.]
MTDTPRTSARNALISLPIFWQLLGLSLVVLVLALGINTLIVLKAPEPPPSGYSLPEVVQALKSGETKLHNGRVLRATSSKTPPAYVTDNPQHASRAQAFDNVVSSHLATELGVPVDTVWVHLQPRGPFMHSESHASFDGPPPSMHNGDPHMGPPHGSDAGPGGMHPPPQLRDEQTARVTGADSRADVYYPAFSAAWKLADGSYRLISPPQSLIEPWQERLLLGFALTALVITPLAWLLSQNMSRPIVAFSEAAAKVSFEDNAPQVASVGPREVRQAADVLNAMQARIKKQVESRTALMGAIAHDLKTPLARMRLRIEDLPAPLREKLSGDITHMDGLIRSAMSFTSAHRLAESLRPLDLSALVESLSDDLAAVCAMEPPLIETNVMVKGDTVALKRIITNLVENAARYAGGCRIELSTRGPQAEVAIVDNGPGVPAAELESIFEPFYRLESSRSRDTGGTGLGLSVARSLAEAQGGTLRLSNRYEGQKIVGCEARLTLPRLVRK